MQRNAIISNLQNLKQIFVAKNKLNRNSNFDFIYFQRIDILALRWVEYGIQPFLDDITTD